MKNKDRYGTKEKITWCPGCPNFMILNAVKKALEDLEKEGYKKESFAMATGIGCHAKIFDYLDISGIYGLHGRVLPTALGIKLGNPNLNVLGFGGDGDTYAEGMAHFIHACRYNSGMTMVVHDNRAFSLTTGQPTPTSQKGYKTKSEPLGETERPLNPILLALSSGATFVARVNARDLDNTKKIIKKAVKHHGFSFVEVLQDCLIFNREVNKLDKKMYNIEKNKDFNTALELAREWDYQKEGKIPVGIFYEKKEKTLSDKWKILKNLKEEKKEWRDFT